MNIPMTTTQKLHTKKNIFTLIFLIQTSTNLADLRDQANMHRSEIFLDTTSRRHLTDCSYILHKRRFIVLLSIMCRCCRSSRCLIGHGFIEHRLHGWPTNRTLQCWQSANTIKADVSVSARHEGSVGVIVHTNAADHWWIFSRPSNFLNPVVEEIIHTRKWCCWSFLL